MISFKLMNGRYQISNKTVYQHTKKKKVLAYTNCQGRNILNILAKHPTLSKEYDFDNAEVVSTHILINESGEFDLNKLKDVDLFIYQPIKNRGKYDTENILKHINPNTICCGFPYLYNYAFWECLVFADGDYAIESNKTNYAVINHEPITSLRDNGFSLEYIKTKIISKDFDWMFNDRFNRTITILKEKETLCNIKVSEFIKDNHKHHLLFHTQNHPTLYLLTYVANQIISICEHDCALLPELQYLPVPDYTSTRYVNTPELPIGWFAWKHFGFTFMNEPTEYAMNFIINNVEKIYNHKYVNS